MADDTYLHYTHEFNGNWIPKAQQLRSRTSDFVDWQSGTFKGERKRFSRMESQNFRRKTERKALTIATNPDTDFRWIAREAYDLANDLDEFDAELLGELVTPTGAWTRSHLAAYQRLMDSVVTTAAIGSVVTGEAGTSSTTFASELSTNQIAAGGAGLTVAKLRAANMLLMQSDLEGADISGDGNPSVSNRILVCTAEQIDNLLGDTQVTSSDYNTVKALAAGTVDTFMGFTFRRYEGLAKVSTTRSCVAWVKGAIVANKGPFKSKISEVPTESDKILVRSACLIGAARLHAEAVVQIDCTETA